MFLLRRVTDTLRYLKLIILTFKRLPTPLKRQFGKKTREVKSVFIPFNHKLDVTNILLLNAVPSNQCYFDIICISLESFNYFKKIKLLNQRKSRSPLQMAESQARAIAIIKRTPNFYTFKESKNWSQGTNSVRQCSLAGRYDNPIPTRFLAPIDCLKIPAQFIS